MRATRDNRRQPVVRCRSDLGVGESLSFLDVPWGAALALSRGMAPLLLESPCLGPGRGSGWHPPALDSKSPR